MEADILRSFQEFVEVVANLEGEATSVSREIPAEVVEAPLSPSSIEPARTALTSEAQPKEEPAPAHTPKSPPIAPKPLPTSAPSGTTGTTEDEPAKLSFKEKMAAFNRTAGSGPPPIKPKPASAGGPGTWSWKQKQAQAAGQTDVISPPSASSDLPAASQPSESPAPVSESKKEPSAEAKGMSASDAKDSIAKGGSLKERMAALQGAGAFGSPSGIAKTPPPLAAKPKVWKRPEPAVGMEEGQPMMGLPPPIVRSMSGDDTVPVDEEGMIAPVRDCEEQLLQYDDEEAKDKERRAAIAARMQKLGGRGMMGGSNPPLTERSLPPDSAESSAQAPVEQEEVPVETGEKAEDTPFDAASPPASIKLPSVPRRAAAPKKRAPARAGSGASTASSVIRPDDDIPVVLNERETPIPETEPQAAEREKFEEAGRGVGGAGGAAAAGIALEPTSAAPTEASSILPSPDTGEEDSTARNAGEPIVSHNPAEADPGDLENLISPAPGHRAEPVDNRDDEKVVDSAPPPPSRSVNMPSAAQLLGLPKDEVELKHEEDAGAKEVKPTLPTARNQPPPPAPSQAAAAAVMDEDEDEDEDGEDDEDLADEPPPPPARPARPSITAAIVDEDAPPIPGGRRLSSGKPMGPRPMPSSPAQLTPASAATQETAALPVPVSYDITPKIEQPDLPTSPVAPRRQQSLSPTSPKVEAPAVIAAEPTTSIEEASTETEPAAQEAERRKGIAARMAKLGGIKFGQMPFPISRKLTSEASPTEPSLRPADMEGGGTEVETDETTAQAPPLTTTTPRQIDEDESEEATTKRRQATLARLRAGGALGFGMFNRQGDQIPTDEAEKEVIVDHRRLQAEPEGEGEDGGKDEDKDEDEAPPPPPPVRTATTHRESMDSGFVRDLPTVPESEAMSHVPVPGSPHSVIRRASSSSRPRVPMSPIQRQGSIQSNAPDAAPLASPILSESSHTLMEEPAVMMMMQGGEGGVGRSSTQGEAETHVMPPTPPPNRPTRGPSLDTSGQVYQHQRSLSTASRTSSTSAHGATPVSPVPPSPVSRNSMSQNQPNFSELKDAATNYGKRVHQAASRLGDHGKKQIGVSRSGTDDYAIDCLSNNTRLS